MAKFVPYEKMSKSQKREMDRKNRLDWGGLNPVTRKTPNSKLYDRKKVRRDDYYHDSGLFLMVGVIQNPAKCLNCKKNS
jgi:hypothetical protein